MVDQQQKANENQVRLQEQMARNDEELTQVHRQLLEVLERKPEPVQAAPMGPQIAIQIRDNDPNVLFKRFRKSGLKEFIGQEDPLTANDWLHHKENIFNFFRCIGRQQVHLAVSMFTGLAKIRLKTMKNGYRNTMNDQAWM